MSYARMYNSGGIDNLFPIISLVVIVCVRRTIADK
jgi:hypothetical protein